VSKVVNFHLPADDVERAAAFYREVFGWDFVPFPNSPVPYLVNTVSEEGPGIAAAITARHEIVKAPTPTIDVGDIDQAMIVIAMNGGQQGRVQDIPGLGRFGYAIDSEGNIIALLQPESPSP
jgi:predicted enzyme related to lactoylglutathione lyase